MPVHSDERQDDAEGHDFQLPLSGSQYDPRERIYTLTLGFQLPLSGSPGPEDFARTVETILSFNSLSRDHRIERWRLTCLSSAECFQLPLSGSPTQQSQEIQVDGGAFQLPLSGSHFEAYKRYWLTTLFQLPLSGSQVLYLLGRPIGQGMCSSFNSLSRDHNLQRSICQLPTILFFQLPLSGSQDRKHRGLALSLHDWRGGGPFNSLSRDHWMPCCSGPSPRGRRATFNSLSRDHRSDSGGDDGADVLQLSTPSLGITEVPPSSSSGAYLSLSTPSLGITYLSIE